MNWDSPLDGSLTRAALKEELQNFATQQLAHALKDLRATIRADVHKDIQKSLKELNQKPPSAKTDSPSETPSRTPNRAISPASVRRLARLPSARLTMSKSSLPLETLARRRASLGSTSAKDEADHSLVPEPPKAETTPRLEASGPKSAGKGTVQFASKISEQAPLESIETENSGTPLIGPRPGLPSRPMLSDDTERDGERSMLIRPGEKFTEDDDDVLMRRAFVQGIVEDSVFETCVGVIVLLNAITLGMQIDFQCAADASAPCIWSFTEMAFCLFFAAEMGCRLYAYRWAFFLVDEYMWNIFDLCLVVMQVVDQVISLYTMFDVPANMSDMRMARLLRMTRITRMVRVLRLFSELHMIVKSVARSLNALCWAMVILLITIYIVSITFMQTVMATPEADQSDELQFWFGSLSRTILTMFECIVGGVGWDRVVRPLIIEVSPMMGLIFSLYIGVSLLAMMNCITAVLVERVLHTVTEDKDEIMAHRLVELFLDDEESITWEDFNRKLGSSTMKELFHTIDVDLSGARQLFELMDVDGSGRLDTDEMIQGFVKMRGPARALEISMLARWVHDLQDQVKELQTLVVDKVAEIRNAQMEEAELRQHIPEATDSSGLAAPLFPAALGAAAAEMAALQEEEDAITESAGVEEQAEPKIAKDADAKAKARANAPSAHAQALAEGRKSQPAKRASCEVPLRAPAAEL